VTGGSRQVYIYTPPGYDDGMEPLPGEREEVVPVPH